MWRILMWLFKESWSCIRWVLSAFKKFFSVTPYLVLLNVLLINLSSIAMMATFFLPLKVIFIIGSGKVPDYFADLFIQNISLNNLVFILSMVAIAFFALHRLTEYLIDILVQVGAHNLIVKSNKTDIFSKQKHLSRNFYKRTCNVLASILFVVFGFGVGVWLVFPPYAFLIIFLICIFVLSGIWYGKVYKKEKVVDNFPKIVNAWSGVCFLVFFGALIMYFITNGVANILVAIVSIVLAKQVIQRAASALIDLVYLYRNRLKFNALFFYAAHFELGEEQLIAPFFKLTARGYKEVWIKKLLESEFGIELTSVNVCWHELGYSHMAGLVVEALKGKAVHEIYFLKLYGQNRESFAKKEVEILNRNWAKNLPSVKLLGVREVEGMTCLIGSKLGQKVSGQELELAYKEVVSNSWCVVPCAVTIEMLARSSPPLGVRLTWLAVSSVERACCDEHDLRIFNDFKKQFSKIIDIVNSQPVFCYESSLKMNLLYNNGEKYLHPNWGSWSIEPVGYGWKICDLDDIERFHVFAMSRRKLLNKTCAKYTKLVALLSLFELHLRSHSYNSALDMMPDIISCTRQKE